MWCCLLGLRQRILVFLLLFRHSDMLLLFTMFKLLLLAVGLLGACAEEEPLLSQERVVFELETFGDIEVVFFPEVAPLTTRNIFGLVQQGLYTSSSIFRVDKNFCAQTTGVESRTLPLNDHQKELAAKTVPLEVKESIKHHAGVLSMARQNDPNSGRSSFSFILGETSWLDMQYTIFGKVVRGMETLRKLEELPTRKEGMFVMPLQRITISNTYWYRLGRPMASLTLPSGKSRVIDGCADKLDAFQLLRTLQERYVAVLNEVQELRGKALP